MKTITLITLTLLLFGCNVQKREIAKLHLLNYRYPHELAADCVKWFPVKDSLGKIVYLPAKNQNYTKRIDSLQSTADSLKQMLEANKAPKDTAQLRKAYSLLQNKIVILLAEITALKKAYKPCAPDTAKQPIYQTNTALINSLMAQLKVKSDSLNSVKTLLQEKSKEASKFKLWFWLIITGFAIYIGVKIYSFFSGGAVVKAGSGLLSLFKK